jgi:drug/metabolite transporter (DMT)-like permease
MTDHRLSILVWAPVVALLWAICFPFITVGLADAPPLLFAALRALLAGLILLAIPTIIRRPAQPKAVATPGSSLSLVAIGFTFTGMGFGGMFLGGGSVSPGLATVLAGSQPLVAALMAAVWLAEPLTRMVQIGMTLGFLGVVLIGSEAFSIGGNQYLVGVAWILVGVLGTATGNVLLKRFAGKEILRPMGLQLLFGSAFLFALSLLRQEAWHIQWSLSFVVSLTVLSSLATAMMVFLWYALLQRYPLNRLNVFSFLTPAFGLLIGQTLFDETLALLQLAGIAVVLLGIAIMQWRGPSERKTAR